MTVLFQIMIKGKTEGEMSMQQTSSYHLTLSNTNSHLTNLHAQWYFYLLTSNQVSFKRKTLKKEVRAPANITISVNYFY